MLTPEEFEVLMKQNFDASYLDQEEKHINADVLMCDVLRQLGYLVLFGNGMRWCFLRGCWSEFSKQQCKHA